ncbi:MAG TPA: acetamidase/formamidase family protein [Xanthobacteraceae bacterium]
MTVQSLGISLSLVLACSAAQAAPAASDSDPLTGDWAVTVDLHGSPIYLRMQLEQKGREIAGKIDGEGLHGSLSGNQMHFIAQDGGRLDVGQGTLRKGILSGSIVETYDTDKAHPIQYSFTATRIGSGVRGAPRHHEFIPSVFYREFSALNKPVLTVSPGDSIHTLTIDAAGVDEKGQSRVLGGNPETGPFFIESAMPGDTLVVHITRLRLTRDYAVSNDGVVARGLNQDLAVTMREGGKPVRWHLDPAKSIATLETPGIHMARYEVPIRPMLGCIAAAPAPARGAPSSADSGSYGGNLDFNEITEDAKVYLPVSVPGALLYVGDGHAAQGDGELNGNALETSLDVEFTVDVISERDTPEPRVESSTEIMALGLGGSLDDAFRDATANMANWLVQDYKLTPVETAEVLGTAAQYSVNAVASRNAGVVLKIRKDRLKVLGETLKSTAELK